MSDEDSGRTQMMKKKELPDGTVETTKHYKKNGSIGAMVSASGGSAAVIGSLILTLQFQPQLLPYASAAELREHVHPEQQVIITRSIEEFDLRRSIKDAASEIDELAQDVQFEACRQEGCAWEQSQQEKLQRRQMGWREDLRLLLLQ